MSGMFFETQCSSVTAVVLDLLFDQPILSGVFLGYGGSPKRKLLEIV